jgi:hypothetical protein
MVIASIFEKFKDRLYAVQFGTESKDELDKTLDFWRDAEEVREFFNLFREDLNKFEPGMKVKEAVKQTAEEAEEIYDRLLEFVKNDKLDELFKPLDNRELDEGRYEFQKLKSKGVRRKSVLRLYAVKFRDWYVITGAAIKVTDQMNTRPHLKTELNKLEFVRKFLQEGNDPEGLFVYLDV